MWVDRRKAMAASPLLLLVVGMVLYALVLGSAFFRYSSEHSGSAPPGTAFTRNSDGSSNLRGVQTAGSECFLFFCLTFYSTLMLPYSHTLVFLICSFSHFDSASASLFSISVSLYSFLLARSAGTAASR